VIRRAEVTFVVLAALMLFDGERHSAALETLALQALHDGDPAQAYRFADRRCRILPLAEAHHYALRGEISHRRGDAGAALADITRALELAPDDLAANRRMLNWGSGQARVAAAWRLLAIEPNLGVIATALAILRQQGHRNFAAIKWTDDMVTGWAVWDRTKQARLTIESETGSGSTRLISDPAHPLVTAAACAANISIKRPRSLASQAVSVFVGKQAFYTARLRSNSPAPSSNQNSTTRARQKRASISIIVPVYTDFEATKACFDSLVRELSIHRGMEIIVVDDASKDLRIKRLLKGLARKPRIDLLTNQHNLGFAGSVNRALGQTRGGDVILLNADTVVPPGSIGRLCEAAHSSPGIGTVTPLSNNGEFTSFPVPFQSNPLGSYQDVCNLDAAAARLNVGRIVDMPNGTGFCLYIKRSCLDRVGFFSEAFSRGYFEDVDFCLRARALGFRNVCAASVYVGHAGSRSFGDDKQSLVRRNLETIERWYPEYRPECAAFIRADPLRPVRAAIELTIAVPSVTLMVTGPGVIRSVVDARAQTLFDAGETALIVETRTESRGPVIRFLHPRNQAPQSVTFKLAMANERLAAQNYLRQTRPARIELADPATLHLEVLDILLECDCPIDVLVANAGLVCPRGSLVRADGTTCCAVETKHPCDECLVGTASIKRWGAETTGAWLRKWSAVIRQARKIYAYGPYARSFASRLIGHGNIVELAVATPGRLRRSKSTPDRVGRSIGFAALETGVADHRLMQDIAKRLNRGLPEWSVVVIGETIDDLGLMRLDNVHVTGPVAATECAELLRQYQIDAVFVATRQPIFGHPKISELAAVPTAFVDWSCGEVSARAADLALNPRLNNDEMADSIAAWLADR
jgi:O-antigen biosynthesis protein